MRESTRSFFSLYSREGGSGKEERENKKKKENLEKIAIVMLNCLQKGRIGEEKAS